MKVQLGIITTLALGLSVPVFAQPAPKPNDAQIAAIAYTADQIDIAAAKQALSKTKNPKVREFAQEMVRDHTAVNNQALGLLKTLHVKPEPNPTSAALKTSADKKLHALARLNGSAFDRAYAKNEVAFHQTVNDALRTTLIPDAQNGQLKGLLQTGLKLFEEHQRHAEQLVAELK
jgi:putative membrane protein